MTASVTIPSREQILYWLHEAAEIEHNLMCCYLYAAFSIKSSDPSWTDPQKQAVAGWSRVITSVALEEMTHLCLVGNLMNAFGAKAHFNRPMFPIESGPYPADFVIRLQPFSQATVAHFKYLERPLSVQIHDASGFAPARTYHRDSAQDRLSPGARDYTTVGELYASLRRGMDAFAAAHGEDALFLGDPALQIDAALTPLPGVCAIHTLADAHRALDTIVTQGEGAGDEHGDSHFCRFSRLGDELDRLLLEDPAFEPAWPAATNPVMNQPPTPDGKVHVNHPESAPLLDLANALYTASLRCLLQGFSSSDRPGKAQWLSTSFALMRALVPLGQGLAARPANADAPGVNAGLTFTSLRTLAYLPEPAARPFVAARLDELCQRARQLSAHTDGALVAVPWANLLRTLEAQRVALMPTAGAVAPTPAAPATPVAAAGIAAAPEPVAPVELARGRALTIQFEGRRCIHSRHCVLEAPGVFKANTPGEWIYPDTMDAERLVAVALSCPSGAIRYERHDGGLAEKAPPVNVLRVRENGPYAVHAQLSVAGKPDGVRATLCRCGQSQRKPWCDGSHVAAHFTASGEPPTTAPDALAVRDGPLQVQPLRDGPLHVTGNLEICAGTGRTAARITQARLCRCGHSRNKPFCDLSHVGAGFTADGA